MEDITDETTEKVYFTQVCNLIDELDLSPLAIALYFHYKRWAFTENKPQHGVKFLKEKYKVGADKIRAAKDELVKNKLMKFKTFDAGEAKPDEAVVVDIWARNFKHFQQDNTTPIPVQEQVGTPIPIQEQPVPIWEQTHSYTGTDPFLSGNALKEEEKEEKEEKEKQEKSAASAFEIYRLYFPDFHLSIFQEELLKGTTDNLECFKQAAEYWATNDNKPKNIHGLLDRYKQNIQTGGASSKKKYQYTPEEIEDLYEKHYAADQVGI